MPKFVDAQSRRELIADAVIDLIVEGGLRSVTFSRIAERTSLAIGSVRHFFDGAFDEVMRFTLRELLKRAGERTAPRSANPVTDLTRILEFVAPGDEQQRKEAIALLEYQVAARSDPAFALDIELTFATARRVVGSLVEAALADRVASPIERDVETATLLALLEGLSVSAALSNSLLPRVTVEAVVANMVERMRCSYPLAS